MNIRDEIIRTLDASAKSTFDEMDRIMADNSLSVSEKSSAISALYSLASISKRITIAFDENDKLNEMVNRILNRNWFQRAFMSKHL